MTVQGGHTAEALRRAQATATLFEPRVTDWRNLDPEALRQALRRHVVCITRRGLDVRTFTRHARVTNDTVTFHVNRLRADSPAVICLNLLPVTQAHWLLANLDAC